MFQIIPFAFASTIFAMGGLAAETMFEQQVCDEVATRAREIMIGRQGGLTRQGARIHLATDALTTSMVIEAYDARVHSVPREVWEAVDSFGELWQQRCEEATPG